MFHILTKTGACEQVCYYVFKSNKENWTVEFEFFSLVFRLYMTVCCIWCFNNCYDIFHPLIPNFYIPFSLPTPNRRLSGINQTHFPIVVSQLLFLLYDSVKTNPPLWNKGKNVFWATCCPLRERRPRIQNL